MADVNSSENEVVAPATPKKRRPVGALIVGALVVGGGIYGYQSWSFGQSHVATDDAYVTNDIVPISPRVAGYAADIQVINNQHVNKGDLLVQLDDSSFRVDVEQARANLQMAIAAAQGATTNVDLTQQTLDAGVNKAEGSVMESQSGLDSARATVAQAEAALTTAEATLKTSHSNEISALTTIRTRQSAKSRAEEQVQAAQALLTSAKAGVGVAQANLESAIAARENADRERDRTQRLAAEGAISQSTADARATAARDAQAKESAARQSLQAAQALITQRTADLNTARAAVREANDAIYQAKVQAQAAHSEVLAQQARLHQQSAGVTAAQSAVGAAAARANQAQATLAAAQTAPQQVSISTANRKSAEAKVAQARAALEAAELALSRTRIVAPVSGTVSRSTIQPGQQVSVGQALMQIVPDATPWVVANFKETQVARIQPGQTVDIEVDAIPGVRFHGKVDSLSAGTGSVFTLLPPDNATGNFTKVVQRLPIKVILDPGQENLNRLHVGLSSIVTINLK